MRHLNKLFMDSGLVEYGDTGDLEDTRANVNGVVNRLLEMDQNLVKKSGWKSGT